nr:DNA ligase D [Gammaproteobacteria bacterium]
GDFPAPGIRRRLARMKLPNIDRATAYTPVMLATRCAAAFSRKEWVYEVKYDGYRLLTHAQGRSITLSSRAGSPLTSAFPEIALAARALPFDHFVIDGEIVVHDAQGLPSFSALQQRARLSQRHDIDHAAARRPATLYAIDLLSLEGKDLRGLPLTKRKALLGEMLPTRGPIRLSEHVVEAGIPMYEQITELGLEGMVAKRADSPYESGRSENWLKIVAEQTDDFAVVGYRKHQTRDRLSALLLAHYTGDGLTYVGRVGSGFTEVERQNLFETLQSAKPAPPPLAAPRDRLYHWIEPKWVAEVRFKAWTQSRNLREPRFLRFRDDKPPSDCRADIELASMMPADESPQTRGSIPGQHAPVTNRDKIYWPADEITKGALIDYYRAISPWLLPYLADRPLVMTRFPDGIDGKSFFQHDAPASTPSWVRTERVWTGHQSKEVSTFIVDNVESLTYIVNLGCIPIHVWSSRLDALDRPDWCLLDLDPKGAPFGDVVTVAKTIHRLCAGAGIPTYPKTTGSSGMHVLIPLGKQLTHRESRQLSEIIARLVANALPDIVSLNRRITQRAGRVYIDFLQNGHGKLMAAPFAARPIPGAPVSMPMTWRQVTPKLDARRYTIRNAMRRMGQSTGDPMRPVLDENVDITAAIARLLNDRSLSEP